MLDDIYHVHHIVPKHAGGTDDPSNLETITLREHIERHQELFKKYGRWEDALSVRLLQRLDKHSETFVDIDGFIESLSKAGKQGYQARIEKFLSQPENTIEDWHKHLSECSRKGGTARRENNPLEVRSEWARISRSKWSPESEAKAAENMRKTARATYKCKHCGRLTRNVGAHGRHEKLCAAGFYDIIWVTDGWDEKQQHKDEPLEEGWFVGRFIDTFTIDDGTKKTIHGGEFTVFKRACPTCGRLLDPMWYKQHVKKKQCYTTRWYKKNKQKIEEISKHEIL